LRGGDKKRNTLFAARQKSEHTVLAA